MRLRVFYFLIAGFVSFHFLAGTSFALQGSGTVNDPYLIASFEDFEEFSSDTAYWAAGVYTRLEADIDLDPELEGRQIYSAAPIAGDSDNSLEFDGVAYKGHFDGNGHVIRNLTIDNADYCGLFGQTSIGSTIANLGMEKVSITGKVNHYVGGLVGYNNNGSITNSYSTGSVDGGSPVGGLVGWNRGGITNRGSITNSYSTCSVDGHSAVGGLVGFNEHYISITSSYSTGSVRGKNGVGGLVGENGSSIINSYSTCSVEGSGVVGGLIGQNYCGNITDSYSTGSVMGDDRIGGLVGWNRGSSTNRGSITDSYSTSSVTGTDDVGGLVGYCRVSSIMSSYSIGLVTGIYNVGGLVGWNNYDSNITSSYSTGLVKGNENVGGLVGANDGSVTGSYFYIFAGTDNGLGVALYDEQLQDKSSFAGFDFAGDDEDGTDDVWTIEPGYMPRLAWQESPGFAPPYWLGSITTLDGSGSPNAPLIIDDFDGLMEFRTNPELRVGYYRLDSDIDMTGTTYSTAFIQEAFAGHFDGNGHVISNLTIDGADADYCGFFCQTSLGSTIANLGMENVSIASSGNDVGGLVGGNSGSITDSYSTGSVTGEYWYVGGLVGHNYDGIITNSYSTVSVAGNENVGGLVGWNSGSVTDCYSTGSATGVRSVGGLAGWSRGIITNSYSAGSVTGEYWYVGGLVGRNYYGNITNSYSTGSVMGENLYVGGLVGENFLGSITSNYSTGSVEGDDYVGGLAGHNRSGSIMNSYSAGSVTGGGYVGGLVGWNDDGSIMNSYSTCSVVGYQLVGGLVGWNDDGSITNSYSTGSVEGISRVGGLVGGDSGSVTGSFWDIEASSMAISDGGVGKGSAEMRDIDTYLAAGWDFAGEADNGVDDVWWINGGRDYPRLFFQPFGDVDNDCRVDLKDLAVMSTAWRSVEGEGNYNSVCELSGDTAIDEADLFEIMNMWLEGGQW